METRKYPVSAFSEMLDDLSIIWQKIGHEGEVRRYQPIAEDASYPIVLGRMLNRVPKKEGVAPLGGRPMKQVPHPDRPGEYLEYSLRDYMMTVEFQVHALTAETADGLTQLLEQLFDEDTALFAKERRIERIVFIEQNEDEVLTRVSKESIAVRKLVYLIEYQEVRTKVVSELNAAQVRGRIR